MGVTPKDSLCSWCAMEVTSKGSLATFCYESDPKGPWWPWFIMGMTPKWPCFAMGVTLKVHYSHGIGPFTAMFAAGVTPKGHGML